MFPFTRFFVSQRFGPAVGTVQMAGADIGFVWIRTKASSPDLTMFDFDPKEFCATSPLTDMLAELLLRTAIAQVHRAVRMGRSISSAQLLMPSGAPWLGDFFPDPICEKAAVFKLRTRIEEDRRRGNPLIENSITTAIRVRKTDGRDAARSFLQGARVPPSVIRRVLTRAVHRRRSSDG